MDSADVKLQMMKLWKSVFHDSDDYIKLVFDNYFSLERVAYKEQNGKIIAALLSVPYEFSISETSTYGSNDECVPIKYIRGLYLCGLATDETFRGMGIMSDLMREIELRAYSEGFAFTFLIPASEGLIKYYADRGYSISIYRIYEHYTSLHNFVNQDSDSTVLHFNELSKVYEGAIAEFSFESDVDASRYDVVSLSCLIDYIKEICQTNKSDVIDNMYRLLGEILHNLELNDNVSTESLSINHSSKDFELVLRENIISHGDVLFIISEENYKLLKQELLCESENISSKQCLNLLACSFIELSENDNELIFKKSLIDSKNNVSDYDDCRNILLQSSKILYHDNIVTVCDNPIDNSHSALVRDFFSAYNSSEYTYHVLDSVETSSSASQRYHPYGMCKILSPYQILKFFADRSDALKYSILVKDEICDNLNLNQEMSRCIDKIKRNVSFSVNGLCENKSFSCPVLYKYDKTNGVISSTILNEEEQMETEIINNGRLDFLSVTRQELAELVFGRIRKDKITDSAIVLPSVRMDAWLLLD